MVSNARLQEILQALTTTPSERLESEEVEFKEYASENALHNAKDLAEEISAIANRKGGVVVVGVRDSSNVAAANWPSQLVGFDIVDLDTTKERLCGKITPRLDLQLFYLRASGKSFLVIRVPKRPDLLVGTTSGKFCIREGKSSRPMSPDEVEAAVKALSTYDWSSEVLLDAVVDDCIDDVPWASAQADYEVRRGTGSVDRRAFLEAIGATRDGSLTKGGLLFLGRKEKIREHLGDFEYRFSWKTRAGELIVNDVWDGCLWESIARAKQYFARCNSVKTLTFEGNDYEAPLLDAVAFHEAYLNAIVHRDYAVDGMTAVTFDGAHLVVTSPGGFYGGVTAANIAIHEPRHRNKSLARTLMLYQLVDRAGMGVLRMGVNSLRYGRAFPRFEETPGGIQVVMEAEFLRAPVFVLSIREATVFGVVHLLIVNSVVEVGFVEIEKLISRCASVSRDPWQAIEKAVGEMRCVELCGTKDGVFVRVAAIWEEFMMVGRRLRVTANSDKHVDLYQYLRRHGSASNADLTALFEYSHSSQTSVFLREARYVHRTGVGRSARWSLVPRQ